MATFAPPPAPPPLKRLFADGEALLARVEDRTAPDGGAEACVALFDRCSRAVNALDLFPGRSTIDDVATADLKYALVPLRRASALGRCRAEGGPAGRLALVERARDDRAAFVRLCARLGVADGEDKEVRKALGDDSDDDEARRERPDETRRRAIARHEATKRADAALAEARQKLARARTAPAEEREELERDAAVAELAAAAAKAVHELTGDDRELDMLRQMAARFGGAAPPAPARRTPADADEAWLDVGGADDGAGLRVLRIGPNAAGDVTTSRERVKAGVFRPTVAGPTMSLEAFADLEIADAQRRAAAQEAAKNHKPTIEEDTRRRDELERDGDDDDIARYDAARDRSEDWAKWCEDHPRGSGNKGNSQL